jgi:hypothetical protein
MANLKVCFNLKIYFVYFLVPWLEKKEKNTKNDGR